MSEVLTRTVRLATTMAGPAGHVAAGAVAEIESAVARLLVESGTASYVAGPAQVVLATTAAPPPEPGRYALWSHSPYRAACERRDEFARLLLAARARKGSAEALVADASEAREAALAAEADLLVGDDAGGLQAAKARASAAAADAEAAQRAAKEAEHEEAVLMAALVRLDAQIERLRGEARRAMAAAARSDHMAAMAEFIRLAAAAGEAHAALLAIQDAAIAALGDSGGGIRAIAWAGLGRIGDSTSTLAAWIRDLTAAGYKLDLQEASRNAH